MVRGIGMSMRRNKGVHFSRHIPKRASVIMDPGIRDKRHSFCHQEWSKCLRDEVY